MNPVLFGTFFKITISQRLRDYNSNEIIATNTIHSGTKTSSMTSLDSTDFYISDDDDTNYQIAGETCGKPMYNANDFVSKIF